MTSLKSNLNDEKKMGFLEFFDGAYVINLPHRTDRRKEMVKELEKTGMLFTSVSQYALPFKANGDTFCLKLSYSTSADPAVISEPADPAVISEKT